MFHSHSLLSLPPSLGGRTAKEIVTWLNKRTGPPAQLLKTIEEAKDFSEKDDVVIIGYFEDENSDKAKAYTSAADSQDTLYFGIVTSKEVAEGMEATMDSIVVYKKFDDGRVVFDGEWDAESIVTFVLGEQLPLVTKFTDEVVCFILLFFASTPTIAVLLYALFAFHFPSDCSQDIWRADEDPLAYLLPWR